jgi:hypothetical protein
MKKFILPVFAVFTLVIAACGDSKEKKDGGAAKGESSKSEPAKEGSSKIYAAIDTNKIKTPQEYYAALITYYQTKEANKAKLEENPDALLEDMDISTFLSVKRLDLITQNYDQYDAINKTVDSIEKIYKK